MFTQNPFSEEKIKKTTQIVFVSDLYVEDYVGGAELTTQALIDECPFEYVKLHSKDVSLKTLEQGHHCHWIFGNFVGIDFKLIPTIVGNMKYSVLEYDYKFCRLRSPEKHEAQTGKPCDCNGADTGKIISAFYYGAQSLWWMSEKQKTRYLTMFPFLGEKTNVVLSSVFTRQTLGTLRMLREKSNATGDRNGWIVLDSNSWVKGASAAKKWCEDNGKSYETIWDLPYDQTLAKMASAEGFVYLPTGGDTCPRMVIEAKLLGCKLELNENVQHKDEEWFATDDLQAINDYLFTAPTLFWNSIRKIMEYVPRISGYTTTYNCVKGEYPFEECIRSMSSFCSEICVIDGGSTDGTFEKLTKLAEEIPALKVRSSPKDFNDKRFAPQVDGLLKAEARKMCTGDFCWQMDSDEIVGDGYGERIIELASKMTRAVDVISLPVIEYWGGPEKIRLDVTPWKWRLSRNNPNITHGIPTELRKYDDEGRLFAAPGTDSCDMIFADSGERVPHVTFITKDTEELRFKALNGDLESKDKYEEWMSNVVKFLPTIHHYSWFSMERKVRHYRDYWSKFWGSMYGEDKPDTPENNVMFDVPWSQVTDEMITEKAEELVEGTGGWIFHRKWNGERIPHMTLDVKMPALAKDFSK